MPWIYDDPMNPQWVDDPPGGGGGNTGGGGGGGGGNPPPAEQPEWRRRAIIELYRKYLHREPDEAGLASWLNGGSGIAEIEDAFKNSEEAKAYGLTGQATGGGGGGGGGAGGGGRSADDIIAQWQQSHGIGQDMDGLVAALRAAGHQAERATNASGISGDKITVNGQMRDLVRDVGGPNAAWQNSFDSAGGGGGGGAPAGGGAMPDFFAAPPAYQSSPFAEQYQPLATPDYLTNPYTAPTWTGGDFQAPAMPAELQNPYVAGQFTRPTQADLESSPGYQSRLAAGLQARNRSAAAQGSLLSGGTQKALARYGQDYASNEYGNLYGQSLAGFGANESARLAGRQQNEGEYQDSFTNAFKSYSQRYGQFMDSANLGLQERQQRTGEFTNAQSQNLAGYQNRYAQYLGDQQRQMNDYLTNWNVTRGNRQDYLGEANKEADRGLTALGYGR